MHHRKEPGAAHHALLSELHGVSKRFADQGMPGVERIAVLAQLIGREVAELPADVPFGSQELLHSIAANIEQGNCNARGDGSNGLLLGLGGRN